MGLLEKQKMIAKKIIIAKVIKRKANVDYFLDDDGDISQTNSNGKTKKILKLKMEKRSKNTYFIDSEGNVCINQGKN